MWKNRHQNTGRTPPRPPQAVQLPGPLKDRGRERDRIRIPRASRPLAVPTPTPMGTVTDRTIPMATGTIIPAVMGMITPTMGVRCGLGSSTQGVSCSECTPMIMPTPLTPH